MVINTHKIAIRNVTQSIELKHDVNISLVSRKTSISHLLMLFFRQSDKNKTTVYGKFSHEFDPQKKI